MTLGKRLRQYRDDRGYSRETAAQMLGVSFSALEKWETDKRRPTLAKAQKLAQFYGVAVSILVGETLSKKGGKAKLADLATQYKDILLALDSMNEDLRTKVMSRVLSVAEFHPEKDARDANVPAASFLDLKKSGESG